MTGNVNQPELAPAIRRKLAALRRRIRRYVWLHGLATAIAWLGVAFWASLGIDWLFEPPLAVRGLVLGIVGLGLGGVLFRLILRRAFVRLRLRNLAMLLERHFPQFDESLLTAVELNDRTADLGPYGHEMLTRTCRQAAQPIGDVRLRKVFNPVPLRLSTLAAVLLAAGVWAFTALAPEAFAVWSQRSLLLQEKSWPRKTLLLVEGFEDGVRKLARGDDLELIAKADLSMPLVPDVVEVRYRTEGGTRLRATMSREGTVDPAQDRFQEYSHTFRGVLAPILFDVIGGDAAVRDLRIEVVDSPTIVEMALECQFPDYMDRPPRTLPVTGVMQLPVGARITVRAKSNKDLVKVEVDDGGKIATIRGPMHDAVPTLEEAEPNDARQEQAAGQPQHEEAAGSRKGETEPEAVPGFRSFAHRLPEFTQDRTLLLTLFDTDGIKSRQPVRLALASVADQPPQLAVELRGIGSAITAEARLPVAGQVTDDYGIARVWFEYAIDQTAPETRPVDAPSGNVTDFKLDHAPEAGELKLTAGQKLVISVKAADRYDLAEHPNVGTSQQWLLDVVTPDQLRTMLEARELVLRQRFERILQEVTESRDSLARVDFDVPASENQKGEADDLEGSGSSVQGPALTGNLRSSIINHPSSIPSGAEPGDRPDEPKEPAFQRALALRTLRVERALQNGRKNAHETLGVAEAFADIREELINNRIDTAELKSRLEQGIADPLRRIAEEMFPELDRRLARLEATLADAGRQWAVPSGQSPGGSPQGADHPSSIINHQSLLAIVQIDAIRQAMQDVLDRMLELEDFNKAVALLREIIRAQEKLGEQTRKRHQEKLRELLED